MTEQQKNNIANRNNTLHDIEVKLRQQINNCLHILVHLNELVFNDKQSAKIETQKQMYQIVDDRLHEVAFPGSNIHRY